MSCVFVGIDPGSSGAVAVLRDDRSVALVEEFPVQKTLKSPTYRKRVNKETGKRESVRVQGKKTQFDFRGVAELFDRIAELPEQKIVMLEAISAMPRDSTTAAFTFGGSFWAIQQALADRNIGYELVTAKDWQKLLLRGMIFDDRRSRLDAYLAKARAMFPSVDLSRKTKDTDKAAALLIAEYCRRMFMKGE